MKLSVLELKIIDLFRKKERSKGVHNWDSPEMLMSHRQVKAKLQAVNYAITRGRVTEEEVLSAQNWGSLTKTLYERPGNGGYDALETGPFQVKIDKKKGREF